jgi:voltage-gated potassium channel
MSTEPRDAGSSRGQALLEKRARRIASGRFVVGSVSITLVVLAMAGAVVMRFFDETDFPTFGLALWWAVETFTTVGFGDIVPTTRLGKFVGGGVMVLGIMFLSFLTASVTSALIERDRRRGELAHDAATASEPSNLSEVVAGIARLEERFEQLEKRLTADD